MKTRLIAASIATALCALPIVGHAADGDSDRSSPKAFVKDATITTKIKAKLAKEKLTSATQIHVDTDKKGVVTLSGKVKSAAEAAKAVSIARDTEGVVSVRNDIQVAANQ